MVTLLTGIKILQEITSPINGTIRVVKSFGLGTYIQVAGLTQSGGVVVGIWKKSLRKIRNSRNEIRKVLILGLGGGSVAKLIREYWPEADILGVDIDPLIVELGRKYLGLTGIKVEIGDAGTFLLRTLKAKMRYDLVVVDIYIGYEFPKKFEEEMFLRRVKRILTPQGVAVFNRLYMADKRAGAVRFGEKLEKVFGKVERVYPEANLMFLCYN